MKRRQFTKAVAGVIGLAAGGSISAAADHGEGSNQELDGEISPANLVSMFTGYDDIRGECRGFVKVAGRAEMRGEVYDDLDRIVLRLLDSDGEPVTAAPADVQEHMLDGSENDGVGSTVYAADFDIDADLADQVESAEALMQFQGE